MPVSESSLIVDGLTSIRSSFGPKETMDRLEGEVRAHGLNVFARIDHAAGAAEVGLTLRPTELIIFGNARGGAPLMQASQTVGIDLPLKRSFGRILLITPGFRITNRAGLSTDMALVLRERLSTNWLTRSARFLGKQPDLIANKAMRVA